MGKKNEDLIPELESYIESLKTCVDDFKLSKHFTYSDQEKVF